MTKSFKFFSDPGHGWLCVTPADLADVGMVAADFSRYSYRRVDSKGTKFYLEEDCDLAKFFRAYEAKHGTKPTIEEMPPFAGQALIRRLPSIAA